MPAKQRKPKLIGDTFRLPSGNITHSVDYFIRAWREFSAPIARVLDMRAAGYDPGVLYVAKGKLSYSLSLPTWAIQKFNTALKKD